MATREEIIAELEKIPQKHLDELYRIIKSYEVTIEADDETESIMRKLRQIKIAAAPDFSTTAKLYDLEEQNAK